MFDTGLPIFMSGEPGTNITIHNITIYKKLTHLKRIKTKLMNTIELKHIILIKKKQNYYT